ncbi:MAG TPA: bacteriophage holin [Actinophytocola sp.]|nr:bacteriophage holin [Actinophytocola sp.]
MSYLPTWIAVAAGLVLLAAVLVRSARTARRFGATASAVNARFSDETGHLKARSAALRVAMNETRARVKHTSVDVPSGHRGRQEDDRG